ncbi:INO80 complex, subunit Ies4 [Talaromyces proteolyticus]|uniref:INO80 complex, subunit Ies4 n=1 Tax=Talaromyces proteolyticus TaxID=1131652 RepID=A0AAD4PWZ1_9EURO|nr:INO80 complex, subunit Ies4 [Talaromyces proteolyticus]KAH8692397.1 INO80 complex, subunit Ies4 [Talaromyces proteolyticus]
MPASSKTNGQPNRAIVLKLPSALLRAFPSDSPPVDNKDKIQDASSPPSSTSGEPAPPASSIDNASDAPSTPANADGKRQKGAPGSRGTKRGLAQNGDSASKAARKPGPKKRKLDDGAIDSSRLIPAHKLGPKANQGAINAGLRALDRTGAPCRKWERKQFQLKSFTGIAWDLSSWRTPKPEKSPETNGEANGVAINGDSDSKANQMSSAVPSEKSNLGESDITPLPAAQSPAPAIAMTA